MGASSGLFRDLDGSIDPVGAGIFGVIALVFLVVGIAGALAIARALRRWNRNNHAPLLTVPAVLVARRQETRGGRENTSHSYHVTFELSGHQRIELPVQGSQWGSLLEGDRGQLTYQGTRFKNFDRTPQDR